MRSKFVLKKYFKLYQEGAKLMPYNYANQNKEIARKLRKTMTKEERHLWYDFLRSYPIKFYRQRRIDRYIVDFYCAQAQLVIELDGGQHYDEDGMKSDQERTAVLESYGLHVIRFTNLEVQRKFSAVCEVIDQYVRKNFQIRHFCKILSSEGKNPTVASDTSPSQGRQCVFQILLFL